MISPGVAFVLSMVMSLLITCQGLKVGDECTNNEASCPENSECSVNVCNAGPAKTCNCKGGYFPREKKEACAKVVDLLRKCDENHVCRQGSYCYESSWCKCKDSNVPSKDNRRCNQRLKGLPADQPVYMQALGEQCNPEKGFLCYDDLGFTECQQGICECKPGYRRLKKTDKLSNGAIAQIGCVSTDMDATETAGC